MGNKKWYESKMVWINVLTILGGVATALAGDLQNGGAISLIGLVNVVLRTMTNSGIKL